MAMRRLCQLVALALGLLRLAGAAPALAQCLSPAAEGEIKQLFNAGTLQAALGPNLMLTGVNLSASRIEIRAQSADGQPYGIDLALPEASAGRADGRGSRFRYHLVETGGARDAGAIKALLVTAELVDRTLPDAAFADCSGQASPPPGQAVRYPNHYPRARALASATFQVLIIVAAAAFGWRVVRSM